MRIQIVKKLTDSSIDARLDRFQPGCQYEVDRTMGLLFLAEKWAEPVVSARPRLVGSLDEMEHAGERSIRSSLSRERYVPSLDEAIAADIAFDDAVAAAIERQNTYTDLLPSHASTKRDESVSR